MIRTTQPPSQCRLTVTTTATGTSTSTSFQGRRRGHQHQPSAITTWSPPVALASPNADALSNDDHLASSDDTPSVSTSSRHHWQVHIFSLTRSDTDDMMTSPASAPPNNDGHRGYPQSQPSPMTTTTIGAIFSPSVLTLMRYHWPVPSSSALFQFAKAQNAGGNIENRV